MIRIVNSIKREATILKNLSKIKDYYTIEGFLSPYEAVILYKLATQLGSNSTIVEIGSWKGKSTYCLARGLRYGHVLAIDPFDTSGDEASQQIYVTTQGQKPLIEQFNSSMKRLNVIDKIQICHGHSSQFVNQIPKINLLFIDGDHSIEGCDFDYTNYAPALVAGGYLAFHDYYATREDLGPVWVVKNKVIPSKHYRLIGLFDSLWVGQKLNN